MFVVMGVCYIGVLEHTLATTGLKSMVHYTRVFVVKGSLYQDATVPPRVGGMGNVCPSFTTEQFLTKFTK